MPAVAPRPPLTFPVTLFGAKGNGTSDDTSAVQATIDAAKAAGGGTVYFPRGNYKLTATLNISASNLMLIIPAGVVLDFSTFTGTNLLSCAGSQASSGSGYQALTANAAKGATSLSVSSSSGFAPGDRVKVASDAVFDPSRTATKIGEIAEVQSVSSGTVTLTSPLVGGPYDTADTAFVAKLSVVRNLVIMGGGEIRGAGQESTAVTTLATAITDPTSTADITVNDAVGPTSYGTVKIDDEYINYVSRSNKTLTLSTSSGFERRGAFGTTAATHSAGATVTFSSEHIGIVIDYAENVTLDGFKVSRCQAAAVHVIDSRRVLCNNLDIRRIRRWGSGYGIDFINACSDCQVVNSRFDDCRHGLTTGSLSGRRGITRFIVWRNNFVTNSNSTGDAIDTHGCTEYIDIDNNTVIDSASIGINCEANHARIRNNIVQTTANKGIFQHSYSTDPLSVVISGNRVIKSKDMGIRVFKPNNAHTVETVCVMENNYVSESASNAIYADAESGTIENVRIANNVVEGGTSYNITVSNVAKSHIVGNVVKSPIASIYGINASASASSLIIKDNIVRFASSSSTTGIYLPVGTDCVLSGNVLAGGLRGVYMLSGTSGTVTGNDASGCTTPFNVPSSVSLMRNIPATVSILASNASYTLVAQDVERMVEVANSSANTLTVPANSSVAFPVGTRLTVLQTGAGQTTITPDTGVTIDGTPGLKLRAQWSGATLIKRDTNRWVAFGDLAA